MKDRIKQLRKSLKLTQNEFGEKIGMVGSAITKYEKGERSLSNAVIQSICREFHVREEWLRTGEGDMIETTPEDLIAQVAREHNLGPGGMALLRVIVRAFETLGPEAMDELFEETIPRLRAEYDAQKSELYASALKAVAEFEAQAAASIQPEQEAK